MLGQEFVNARLDVEAIVAQEGLKSLLAAVWALDELRAKVTLVRLVAGLKRETMPLEDFRAWMEREA